eukprot:3952184-Prymnesium_polylepis.1
MLVVWRLQEFIMLHGLQAPDLVSIFNTFDLDGNGWLDMQEFKSVLQFLRLPVPPYQFRCASNARSQVTPASSTRVANSAASLSGPQTVRPLRPGWHESGQWRSKTLEASQRTIAPQPFPASVPSPHLVRVQPLQLSTRYHAPSACAHAPVTEDELMQAGEKEEWCALNSGDLDSARRSRGSKGDCDDGGVSWSAAPSRKTSFFGRNAGGGKRPSF